MSPIRQSEIRSVSDRVDQLRHEIGNYVYLVKVSSVDQSIAFIYVISLLQNLPTTKGWHYCHTSTTADANADANGAPRFFTSAKVRPAAVAAVRGRVVRNTVRSRIVTNLPTAAFGRLLLCQS
jgi:hypothetical protein